VPADMRYLVNLMDAVKRSFEAKASGGRTAHPNKRAANHRTLAKRAS
jgi:hypothetical protein